MLFITITLLLVLILIQTVSSLNIIRSIMNMNANVEQGKECPLLEKPKLLKGINEYVDICMG